MHSLRPIRPYNFPTFHGRIITPQLTTNPVGKITFELPTSILSEQWLLLLVRAQGRHLWGVASWC
jgi:hypothetical protein